jgi:hypothetical protein
LIIKRQREHLTFAAKLEIGVRSQESGARRKEEEGRRKKEGARRSVFTNMRCSQGKAQPLCCSKWKATAKSCGFR